jgi:drug/metabolite transporter (DMT)-like permease
VSEQTAPPVRSAGRRERWLGPALIVVLAFVWGLNWPAIRVAVMEVDPWSFRAICMVTGSFFLFGVALAQRAPLRVPRADIAPLILLGLLNVAAYQLLSAFGLTMVEAGRGVILAFTFPLWSVLLGAIVLREKLTAGRLAALALGLVAMGILMGADLLALGRSQLGGLMLIASAVSWAAATIYYKSRSWTLSSQALAAWQVLVGAVPVTLGALLLGDPVDFEKMSSSALIGVVYASVIAVPFGQWTWFRVLQLMPSSVASISTLAVPVIGVFSSALLLGEPLGWRELAALALICAALFLVLVGREGIEAIGRVWRKDT